MNEISDNWIFSAGCVSGQMSKLGKIVLKKYENYEEWWFGKVKIRANGYLEAENSGYTMISKYKN